MMSPEQILHLQCSKTQRNRRSNILRPLRWSNILRHRPHPVRRLPPWPRQNCRAHHPNHRPHGLLHPRFPQLQTRRLLWWFWWFWGFDGFYSLFDQWVKGEFDDGAWWSRFWLVADDGARSAVAMLDDGGLIVDRNFKYHICF